MNIVTSYKNPDTDGIASAIAVAAYPNAFKLKGDWCARFDGSINEETAYFCTFTKVRADFELPSVAPDDWFALVDTSDRSGLPTWVNSLRVSLIIDHHPLASDQVVTAPRVFNECVGAAATLVAEFLLTAEVDVSVCIARLLQLAILSNTLSYQAPSTTERDRVVFGKLAKISGLSLDDALNVANTARQKFVAESIENLLLSDVKRYSTGGHLFAVAQVEGPGVAREVTSIPIGRVSASISQSFPDSIVVLNVVDTSAGVSCIFVADETCRDRFLSMVKRTPSADLLMSAENDWITLPFLALRKSHIFPWLSEMT